MWNDRRTSPRFSHVPALPPIPSSLSPWQQSNPRLPRQHRDPQIVESDKHTPLGPGSGGGDSPRRRNEGPSTNRINQLEKKVWMLEQANRSLKEELLQIQGETRSLHLTTDGCQQELESLRRLLESKTGYLEALSERVLQNEKRIEQGQGAVGSLVRSSQEVEKELLDGQREMVSRRDQLLVAMEHTQAHLHQLERRGVAFQETSGEEQRRLGEVVQRWRGSWERQSAETDSSVCGLKQQLKKLELEQETLVEGLVGAEVAIGRLDSSLTQLRRHLDSKLSELGTGLTELRVLLAHQEGEKKRQETWLKDSFSQVQEQVSWLSQKLTASLQVLSSELEKTEQKVASDHTHLAQTVATALEGSSKETWDNNQKLRETLETKIERLEKASDLEREGRSLYETETSDRLRTQWVEAEAKVTEQIDTLKDALERETKDVQRSLVALSESISLQDQENRLNREELSTVLNAEIKTRQEQVVGVKLQSSKVHEMCRGSVSTLREALISLEERQATEKKEVQLLRESLNAEWQEMTGRMLADVNARVLAVHDHISSLDTTVVAQTQKKAEPVMTSPQPPPGSRLQQLQFQERQWREAIGGQVANLQSQLQETSSQLHQLASAVQGLRMKLGEQIQLETSDRFQAVLSLRHQLANLQSHLPLLPVTHGQHQYAPRPPPGAYSHPHHLQAPPPSMTYYPGQAQGNHHNAIELSQRQRTEGDQGSYMPPQELAGGANTSGGHGYYDSSNKLVTFPEFVDPGRESFLSDETEEEEGEKGGRQSENEQCHDFTSSHFPREPFETSPEPYSVQSSLSESCLKKAKKPPARVTALQHRNRSHGHPQAQVGDFFGGAESQGTFTSAAPTPDSQKRVLLRPQSVQDDGGQEERREGEGEGGGGEEVPQREGEFSHQRTLGGLESRSVWPGSPGRMDGWRDLEEEEEGGEHHPIGDEFQCSEGLPRPEDTDTGGAGGLEENRKTENNLVEEEEQEEEEEEQEEEEEEEEG